MILGYLILAHLLADFVLQPSKLVLWKIRSKYGVFVHVLVHFVINIIVLLPFILNGYYWPIVAAFVICFAHFWIDQAKISYDLSHDKKVMAFLTDQLIHLLTIMLVYFFVQNLALSLPVSGFYSIYSDIRIVIFFSFLNSFEGFSFRKSDISLCKILSCSYSLTIFFVGFFCASNFAFLIRCTQHF